MTNTTQLVKSARHRRIAYSMCLAVSAGLGIGCAVPQDDRANDEAHSEVEGHTEALWSNNIFVPWPGGIVPVCFQPFSQIDYDASVQYAEQTARIRTVVEQAFETLPGMEIDFAGWEICSDWKDFSVGSKPGKVRVLVRTVTDATNFAVRYATGVATIPNRSEVWGSTRLGYEADMEAVVGTERMSFGADFNTALLHEFGHLLGFDHEYLRDDNTGACKPAAATQSGLFLTDYDADSIMLKTYCGPNAWASGLSTLDKVAFEFAYPRGDVKIDLASANALQFDGRWAIRSSAPFSITNDYIRRGIKADRLGSVEWYLDGGLTWDTKLTATANFGLLQENHSYMLVHSFVDPWQRDRGGLAELVASDAKHAAVILSAL